MSTTGIVIDTLYGNIGIGTSIPLSRLDVHGRDVRMTTLIVNTTCYANTFVGNGSGITGITGGGSQWVKGATSNIYYNGNVGIGTTYARARLEVVGDSVFSGDILPSSNLYDIGTSNLRWKDIYLSGNTIDIGGTRISKNAVSGELMIRSSTGNYLPILAGSIGIGTTIIRTPCDIFGNAIVYGNIGIGTTISQYVLDADVCSANALIGNGSGITGISNSSSSQWITSGSNIYYTLGNVGIGTTNPNSILHIGGYKKAIIEGEVSARSFRNRYAIEKVRKTLAVEGYLDVSTAGNTGAKGFRGGFTDGRYVYLVPCYNGVQHGIFTRVDTQNFTTSGVSYVDVSTGNANAKGFVGGFTDGKYAYLCPEYSNSAYRGILTRIDLYNFTTTGVSYLDVSTAGNTGAKGFEGGFTDGKYAYLVPYNSGVYNGILTRVDLQNFTTSGVSYLDVSTAGNTGAKGFQGGFTDGKYVYLVPNYNGSIYHGLLTRVEINNFTTGGVSYLDVSTGNANAKGFAGGFTDGRYGYLIPFYNGSTYHGVLTRVDLATFTSNDITYVDVSTAGNTDARGFIGGFTDGIYAYLAPYYNGTNNHGILTRIDLQNFTTNGVVYLDVSTAGNTGAKGFRGGFTDGTYAYFVPDTNGSFHGILTRVNISDTYKR